MARTKQTVRTCDVCAKTITDEEVSALVTIDRAHGAYSKADFCAEHTAELPAGTERARPKPREAAKSK